MTRQAIDPHTNRLDGTHTAPAHTHRDEPTKTCVSRHGTEPAGQEWMPHGGFFEDLVVPHSHGEPILDGDVVAGLLTILGLDCGGVGVHTHQQVRSRGQGVYATQSGSHHHHDIRCLVEAGANPVRRQLLDEQQHSHRLMRTLEEVRDTLARKVGLLGELQTRYDRLAQSNEDMRTFMKEMPAVGPWENLREQYNAWLDERDEQAQEDAGE